MIAPKDGRDGMCGGPCTLALIDMGADIDVDQAAISARCCLLTLIHTRQKPLPITTCPPSLIRPFTPLTRSLPLPLPRDPVPAVQHNPISLPHRIQR